MPKEKLTQEKILINTFEELEIPGVGVLQIREPTRGEKIQAKSKAEKVQEYDKLSEQEKADEYMVQLLPFITREPNITIEDMNNTPIAKQQAIVETCSGWLYSRMRKLNDERKQLLNDFFGVTKVNSLPSSSNSSNQ